MNSDQSTVSRKTQPARFFLAIPALCLAAFALRAFRLDAQSLWYDEAFSVYLAHFDLAEITARTAADIQPPLYYYLLHFWIALAGDSEFALRFLSLGFGVLTIPLLFVTARRLFDARSARIAALIATLSPLYLWYSQEARMYALITFLLLLSSYALLRLQADWQSRRWRLIFIAANIAAIYAHYFAFAIITFQILYALYAIRNSQIANRKSQSRIPLSAFRIPLYAFAFIFLAFLPWLPHVLARLNEDASYWRGALKLDEAIRHIFINFTMGESVLESQAQWLAAGWLIALLGSLLVRWLGNRDKRSNYPTTEPANHSTTFLILYFVIPLALLLFLFSRNPKFNARYLMIASPPLFILLGAGLASLHAVFARTRSRARVVWGALLITVYCLLITSSAYSDWNLYTDPAFTKADFRKIARYLEQNATRDDAIILTSGHLFPAFNYYYRGDLQQIRLPDDATLNTDHVLNYDAARVLNATLAGKRGAWVVQWQDEVVDPNGFVPMLLSSRGIEQKVNAAFYQTKLRYWTLTDAKFLIEPEVALPRRANFKNQIELLGITPMPAPADAGASFYLYWRALDVLAEDYQVALRVRDAAGNLWGKQDRRPAGYNYPTPRWKKDEKLFGAYSVPLLPGAPAGEYFIEVTLYTATNQNGLDVLAANGAPLGKSAKLGPIQVLPPKTPATFASLNTLRENTISQPLGPFTLLGYALGRDKASAGESIPLTLFWRADEKPTRDYSFRVQFGDVYSDPYPISNLQSPTSTWRAGEIVRGQYQIAIPAEAKAGAANLRVVLSDGNALAIAPFVVEKTDRVFVKPIAPIAQSANFGDVIALVGYDAPTTLKVSDPLTLLLYWHARGKMDKPYTFFVHLLDKNSQVVAQRDAQPINGARPTTTWIANEYLIDVYPLPLPNLAAGEYRVEIGWYDASDPAFARLQVLDDNGAAVSDHVILKTIIIVR